MQNQYRRPVLAGLFLLVWMTNLQAQSEPIVDSGQQLPPGVNGFALGTIGNTDRIRDLVIAGTEDGAVWFAAEDGYAPRDRGSELVLEGLVDDPVIADFNGDGLNDVFGRQRATDQYPTRYGVWLYELSEFDEFLPAPGPVGDGAIAVDIDGDGDKDVIASTNLGTTAYLNDGNGQFPESRTVIDERPDDLAAADLDADGDPDLLLALRTGFQVWRNDSLPQSGTLGPFVLQQQELDPSAVGFRSLVLADLDGDRDIDLYIGNRFLTSSRPDSLWLNAGGYQGGDLGRLSQSDQVFPDRATYDADLRDVNDDGLPDLVIASGSGLEVWRNTVGAASQGTMLVPAAELRQIGGFARVGMDSDLFLDRRRARIVVCCDVEGGEGFTAVKFTDIDPPIPSLTIQNVGSSGVNIGTVYQPLCLAGRPDFQKQRSIQLVNRNPDQPLNLALDFVRFNGGRAVTSSVEGEVEVNDPLPVTFTCDAREPGFRGGVQRSELRIEDLQTGAKTAIPVRCGVYGNCPEGACECRGNPIPQTCCPYVCWLFRLQLRIFGKSLSENDAVALLHAFRDGPMRSDPVWDYFRMRYTVMSDAMIFAMLNDVEFAQTLRAEHGPWLEGLRHLVEGTGADYRVTTQMQASFSRVMDFLEQQATEPLADEVKRERRRLALDSVDGLTMDEFFLQVSERGAELADTFYKSGFE